jgi:hypothetical protein
LQDTHSTSVVVRVDPRRVAIVLAAVAGTIVVVSVILNVIKVLAGAGSINWLVELFRLNQEQNIPSFLAGLLWLTSAVLFGWVWRVQAAVGDRRVSWLLLSLLFLFFAYDELFEVHELLIVPMRERFGLSGLLHFAWIPVYLLLVAGVAWVFWPAWRDLERRLKMWFAAAAATFLSGAVFFEMLGGARYTGAEGDVVYGMLYTIEESLELAGLIMLVYALLSLAEGSSLQVHDPMASSNRTRVAEVYSASAGHQVTGPS